MLVSLLFLTALAVALPEEDAKGLPYYSLHDHHHEDYHHDHHDHWDNDDHHHWDHDDHDHWDHDDHHHHDDDHKHEHYHHDPHYIYDHEDHKDFGHGPNDHDLPAHHRETFGAHFTVYPAPYWDFRIDSKTYRLEMFEFVEFKPSGKRHGDYELVGEVYDMWHDTSIQFNHLQWHKSDVLPQGVSAGVNENEDGMDKHRFIVGHPEEPKQSFHHGTNHYDEHVHWRKEEEEKRHDYHHPDEYEDNPAHWHHVVIETGWNTVPKDCNIIFKVSARIMDQYFATHHTGHAHEAKGLALGYRIYQKNDDKWQGMFMMPVNGTSMKPRTRGTFTLVSEQGGKVYPATQAANEFYFLKESFNNWFILAVKITKPTTTP